MVVGLGPEERKCIDCGAPLPVNELQPVCPACIFRRLANTGSTIYPPEDSPERGSVTRSTSDSEPHLLLLESREEDALQLWMEMSFGFFDKEQLARSLLLGDTTLEIIEQHAHVKHIVQTETVSAWIKILQSVTRKQNPQSARDV